MTVRLENYKQLQIIAAENNGRFKSDSRKAKYTLFSTPLPHKSSYPPPASSLICTTPTNYQSPYLLRLDSSGFTCVPRAFRRGLPKIRSLLKCSIATRLNIRISTVNFTVQSFSSILTWNTTKQLKTK